MVAKLLHRAFVTVLVLFLFGVIAFAQEYCGTITGKVADPQGAKCDSNCKKYLF